MSRDAPRIARAASIAKLLVIALAPASTLAQPAGRIDGTSIASFERSVAALQNDLSPRRREELEVALAAIWVSNTVVAGDLDLDGDVDLDDGRRLEAESRDLLVSIQRGDLVAAIEKRSKDGAGYTAMDYVAQLHGLGYDEVIVLADRPGGERYTAAALRELEPKGFCGKDEQSPVRLKWCEAQRANGPQAVISADTGKALNEAIQALNAKQYAEARIAIAQLKRDRLTPYERSKTEQILFSVALAEKDYAEAREHLQQAVAAGGLNEQEAASALNTIRALDSHLATNPP